MISRAPAPCLADGTSGRETAVATPRDPSALARRCLRKRAGTLFERVDHSVHCRRAAWAFREVAVHVPSGARVLNFGAGDCLFSRMIEIARGCRVTNVDVVDTNLTDMAVDVYNGVELPYPDASFDVVITQFVLHHCIEQERVLREIARVCRTLFLAIEDRCETSRDLRILRLIHWYLGKVEGMPPEHCRFRSADAWAAMFRQSGFRVASTRTWPRYLGFLPPGTILIDARPEGRAGDSA